MRSIPAVSFFVLCLSFTGCVKEDPAWPPTVPVELKLVPKWNGMNFNKNTVYLSAANERVLVQLVRFYLSDIQLTGADGSTVLSRAELFDVTNGATTRSLRMPVGTYANLHFGLGLPPDLNHADITDIDPFSPLGNNSGMYWTWNTMYRFLLFDGRFDTDAGSTGTLPFQFSIHTGRDACYRERTVQMNVSVVQADTVRITLNVDIAHFFTDGSSVLAFSQASQSHGEAEALALAIKLSDLAVQAIDPQ